MVPMEGTAITIVQGMLSDLTANVATILPIGLGIGATVFGAMFLFKTGKKAAKV